MPNIVTNQVRREPYFKDNELNLLYRIDKNGDRRYVFSVGSIKESDHEKIKQEAQKSRLRIRDMYEDIIQGFYRYCETHADNVNFTASPKGSKKRQQWIRYEVLQMAKELSKRYNVSDTAVMLTAIKYYFRD